MDDSQAFQVRLSELESIADRISGFVAFLSDSMAGLEQRIGAVQQNWTGEGADAQAAAFQKWLTGAAEVSAGIADMKQAAAEAHSRYSNAAAANIAMLGR
ncbi:WXG100 family type VII secretion target [Nocardia otitidiscaviarum]|uniref:WXG100 family type VII secretion target n=1 Tax=Nocardia otitidiscaviarum TaxID=1823 RepID=UPI0004A6B7FA|nr:WXG100 family type VII secretion target [Nocardia otitidiscaviarum]MBF6138374.1 WXG100 family type VII secretion target [Nocardia otitidiscaviarum]MBF6483526.1 WXG100 family type VII secretion target [Nocardia otitidiscaviarum]